MKPTINIDNINEISELMDTVNKRLNENQLFTEANQFQNEIIDALNFDDALLISKKFVDLEKPDIFSIPIMMKRGYIVSHENAEIIERIIQGHKEKLKLKKPRFEEKNKSVKDPINKKKFDAYQNPGVDEADFVDDKDSNEDFDEI